MTSRFEVESLTIGEQGGEESKISNLETTFGERGVRSEAGSEGGGGTMKGVTDEGHGRLGDGMELVETTGLERNSMRGRESGLLG